MLSNRSTKRAGALPTRSPCASAASVRSSAPLKHLPHSRQQRLTLSQQPPPATPAHNNTSNTSASRLVARYKQPDKNIEQRTSAPSFSSFEKKREGPICVAFDCTEDAVFCTEWVLQNYCYPSDESEHLIIVHCVPDPWRQDSTPTAVGMRQGGLGAVYTYDPTEELPEPGQREHVERLKQKAAAACQKQLQPVLAHSPVKCSIQVEYIPGAQSAAGIGEMLLAAADNLGARTLVVSNHGPGAQAEYGSVVRFIYADASMPALLVPSRKTCESCHTAKPAAVAPEPNIETPPTRYDFDDEHPPGTPHPLNNAEAVAQQAFQQKPAPETQHLSHSAHSAAEAVVSSPLTQSSDEQKEKPVTPARREVLVVVQNLEELEDHWQWIADNVCHKGDTLTIWHIDPEPAFPATGRPGTPIRQRPDGEKAHGGSLASLPTALCQMLRKKGLADAKYVPVYSETIIPRSACPPQKDLSELGTVEWCDPSEWVAKQVCLKASGGAPYSADGSTVRVVCVLNYNRLGLVAEAIWGSVASHLIRTCSVPILLLQPEV